MYRNIPILYRVLESFFRYRLLFLISAVIVTVIPGAVLLTRKTTYTSTALVQVIVEDMSQILGDASRTGSWLPPAQQHINRFNDKMSDDKPGGFVESALQRAQLAHPINVDPRAKDPRMALLRKNLNLTSVSDTVFSINLVWDNSEECEKIVQAMEDQYIESTGKDKTMADSAVVEFLDSELKRYSGQLRDAENKVIAFKKENQGQGDNAQTAQMEQLNDLKIHLNELEVTSHNTELNREAIQARLSKISPTSIKEDQRIEMENPLVIEKNGLLAERQKKILGGYLPTSTSVTALDTQIKAVQDQIDAAPKNPAPTKSITTMQPNPEYQDLQSRLNDVNITGSTEQAQMGILQKQIAEYEARIALLPIKETQLNDVMRPFNVLKAQYEDLLKRREQARLKENLEKVAAVSILKGLGTVYAQSTGGKAKTGLMLGGLLVFGLILGVGVTVLAEWADPTVRFATDVQRRLGVPVLISLPELEPLRTVTSIAAPTETAGGRPMLPARDE